MAKDPVCGMDVDPKKAAGKSDYKGREIYFCSLKCKERFDASPEAFISKAQPEKAEAHKAMVAAEAGAHETAKDPICGMVGLFSTAALFRQAALTTNSNGTNNHSNIKMPVGTPN